LEIKNLFTVFEDHVVVQLTESKEFICNLDDLHIVEDHVWHLNAEEEITTKIDGHVILFHNIVINHVSNKQNTIYHINRDHYNCHKSNLGLVDKRAQNIVHAIQKNNRSEKIIDWALMLMDNKVIYSNYFFCLRPGA